MVDIEANIRSAVYEREFVINAARARVWQALTAEVQTWWLPDYHMLGPDSIVQLETHAGGTLSERVEGGASLEWYAVQMCTPGESIDLVGHLSPDYGGPGTTMFRIALEEQAGKTLFKFRDALIGRLEESTVQSLDEGWLKLFQDGLKAYVER